MQLFGRPSAKLFEISSSRASELESIEIVSDPETLRRLAAFLEKAADQMTKEGSEFSHLHLLDVLNAHGSGLPDVIISPLAT